MKHLTGKEIFQDVRLRQISKRGDVGRLFQAAVAATATASAAAAFWSSNRYSLRGQWPWPSSPSGHSVARSLFTQ